MSEAATTRRFGEGVLSRAAALVYTLLVIELLLVLAALPGLVPLVLLRADPSNVPLAAAAAIPFGPALSAAVYALHRRSRDITDLKPASMFWRGYRMNVGGVLRIWVPWLAAISVVGVGLANFPAAGLPGWWAALLVVVGSAATLWMANALVITSLFVFRTVDIVRLAAYFLGRRWGVTLGNAGLLVLAAGIVYLSSEAVLAVLGAIFAAMLVQVGRPMIDQVREDFTA